MTTYELRDGKLYQIREIEEWDARAPCQGTSMGAPSTYSLPACLACGGVQPSNQANREFVREAIGHRPLCPIARLLDGG
jgi:hypothetical protein